MTVRVGMGFDVHPFSDDPARPLVLGGVEIAGARGLRGHSDADVIAHAVADALLGGAGFDDLGHHFPASDQAWAGANSLGLLSRAVALIADGGWTPVNVDCTVVLDEPLIGAHVPEMRERLAGAAGAPVNVKAKRAEGLGPLGHGEGVACWAVALVERP